MSQIQNRFKIGYLQNNGLDLIRLEKIRKIRLDLAFKSTLGKAGKNGKYCFPVYWVP